MAHRRRKNKKKQQKASSATTTSEKPAIGTEGGENPPVSAAIPTDGRPITSESQGMMQELAVAAGLTTKPFKPVVIQTNDQGIVYSAYEGEHQIAHLMELFEKDLSEPYSIFTYRYFIRNWPQLCYLARDGDAVVGAIVCKLDHHRGIYRGYIAMLAVDKPYRKRGIGSQLVVHAINAMRRENCEEVVLETEITNVGALALYERLGFVRDKRLGRYYLNGVDAFRLKLYLWSSE